MAAGLKLIFLSYWSADEPLVRSTILPYLRLMARSAAVEQVWLVTVERGGNPEIPEIEPLKKVRHVRVTMRNKGRGLWTKVDLFIRLYRKLVRLVDREGIHVIDSKAALAGGLAWLVHRATGVPFVVESFEPHADYMAGTGTWSRKGLYYALGSWMERKQRGTARYLVTVTRNYAEYLLRIGVPDQRLFVVPSITDVEKFSFDARERARMRAELGWDQAVIGIYVGKFGGLYYDEEAFAVFRCAQDQFGPGFRMVLLTNTPVPSIEHRLAEAGIAREHVLVRYEEHDKIPQWLSASDLAFSTIRHAPHGLYQSPVKNGEYWANGLPILLTTGVGDDHLIIKDQPYAGALFDPTRQGSVDAAVHHMKQLVDQGVDRARIMALAHEHRSIGIAERVYGQMLTSLHHEAFAAVGDIAPSPHPKDGPL